MNSTVTQCANDVYFACGNGVNNNLGNMKYRELIAEFSKAYKSPNSTKRQKDNISKTIISIIQSLGGTFYHQPEGSEGFVWEKLCPEALNKKVKQSLRDSNKHRTTTTINSETRKSNNQASNEIFIPEMHNYNISSLNASCINNNFPNETISQEPYQSSVNFKDLMEASIGTISGIQSMSSVMDFTFSDCEFMSNHQLEQ